MVQKNGRLSGLNPVAAMPLYVYSKNLAFRIDAGAGYAKLIGMLKTIIASALLCVTAGCLSFGFKTERKSLFTDVDNNSILVEYATEKHVEKLPNGGELNFDRKIRITMPDGKRAVLYQTLSRSGVRYRSTNKKYLFVERGPWCKVLKNGLVVYQGIFRKNCALE